MEQSTSNSHVVTGLKRLVDTLHRGLPENGVDAVSPNGPSGRPPAAVQGSGCGDGFGLPLLATSHHEAAYFGIELERLVEIGCFETAMWLLVHRELPDAEQLSDAVSVLWESATIDRPIAETIGTIPLQTRPLDLFPLAISLLSSFDPTPNDLSHTATRSHFWRLMAQLPVLLHAAFGGRTRHGRADFDLQMTDREDRHETSHLDDGIAAGLGNDGQDDSVEIPACSWAGQVLRILRGDGTAVTAREERAMNVAMICACVTDNRPADQMARSVAASVTDIPAAWKASSALFVSQLRNDPYLWAASLLNDLTGPADAQSWWEQRDGRGMPFGFSPESEQWASRLLKEECRELLGRVPAMVMESSAARLESLLACEDRYPTIDWSATRLLCLLGVPEDRISIAIGLARLVGWAAHHLDQAERGDRD